MRKLISLVVVFFLSVFGAAATAEPASCSGETGHGRIHPGSG